MLLTGLYVCIVQIFEDEWFISRYVFQRFLRNMLSSKAVQNHFLGTSRNLLGSIWQDYALTALVFFDLLDSEVLALLLLNRLPLARDRRHFLDKAVVVHAFVWRTEARVVFAELQVLYNRGLLNVLLSLSP